MSSRNTRLRGTALSTFVFVACCLTAGAAFSQSETTLFGTLPPASRAASPQSLTPPVLRTRLATMNLGRLDAATAAADSTLQLNLFDDVLFLATRERIEQDARGFTTWVGRVAGDPLSTVTLTRRDDIVSGQISTRGRAFRIRSVAPGVYRIDEIDLAALPNEHEPILPPGLLASSPAASPSAAHPQAAPPVVDILVLYTPAVRARLGQAVTVAHIVSAIADTNTAFERSQISGSVRLAGAAELQFVESTSIQSDLQDLASDPAVQQLRDSVGADVVSLIAERVYGGTCGIGYLGPSPGAAYSIVSEPCFAQYSLTHEVGHNLGAGHAPGDDSGSSVGGWKSYSFGYKSPNTTPRFRTVMAYDCAGVSCPRVLNFSSPVAAYQGFPTGNALQDNARTLKESLPLVQAFRSSGTVTEAPSAPLNPRATVSGSSVFLSWQPPATGSVSQYRVVAGSSPGASDILDLPVGTNLAFTSTAAAGTYYVRIVAENSLGASPASTELTVVVGGNDLMPGPPASLAAQVYGSSVTLTWSRPAVGPTPASYLIEVGSAPGASDLAVFTTTGPFFYTNGVPNGLYYVRVRAQSSGLIGDPSNEVSLRVGPDGTCQAPTPPPGLIYSLSGNTVTLHWAPAGSGTPPLSYIVEAGSALGVPDYFYGSVGGATTVSAAVPSGTYFIRVRTANACGTSEPSMSVSFRIP